jgi:TRAP-type C4-dicarboxylate transport system permease small subunit
MLSSIIKIWNQIETVLIGLLLIVALGVFMWGSFTRYALPEIAPGWTEEVAIYCIVWASLISGSILAYERRHLSAEVFIQHLPKKIYAIWEKAIFALMFLFCGTMAYLGWEGVLFVDMLDERSASSLQAPQAWVLYLALPVGMVLMVLRMIVMVITRQWSVSSSEMSGD